MLSFRIKTRWMPVFWSKFKELFSSTKVVANGMYKPGIRVLGAGTLDNYPNAR